MKRETIITDEYAKDKRIDAFISEKFEDLSRSYVQKLIKDENITINGKTVKANYKIRKDDIIVIDFPETELPEIEPENIPLDIIYEDDDILIVNKPKDMVVHPAPGHYTGTLVNAVMYHCADKLSGINGVLRPGIVHRIDKDTTGCLVICKSDKAHQFLADQLAVHSISRKYRAIVIGNLKEDDFTVSMAIGRDPKDRKKMAAGVQGGRDAVTDVHVISRLNGYTYVECTLHTGRTHQIRVHMKSIGHPVLGDELYGPARQSVKGLKGQCLHAYLLGFIHPKSGEYIEFTAPMPEYFTELLRKLS